jgi:hypothetical protein
VDPNTNLPVKDTDLAELAKEKGMTPEQYATKYKLKKQAMAPMYFNPYTRRIEHSGINFDPRTINSPTGTTASQFIDDTKTMTPAQIQGYSNLLRSQRRQNPYTN